MAAKRNINQPELHMETPAVVTAGQPGDPAAATPDIMDDTPDIMDDTPDKVSADLRKYNKTQAKIAEVVKSLKGITVIIDAAGVDNAQKALKEASAIDKIVETKRLELSKPYRDQVDRINAHAKDLLKDLPGSILAVKKVILAYHTAEEEKAKKKRTEIREFEMTSLELTLSQAGNGFLVPHYCDQDTMTVIFRKDLENASDQLWRDLVSGLVLARVEQQRKHLSVLEAKKEGADFLGDDEAVAAVQAKIDEVKAVPHYTAPAAPSAYAGPRTKGLMKRWLFEITDSAQVPRSYCTVDEKLIRAAVTGGARVIPGVRIYEEESISIR